ncbi:HAD-IIA family hydrolase [Ktedonosporobacter rubrisoli]|uniref:HAD-IIA family hydrolase n=1 Tax=Ktedonosporobacter rubrisoli TaxID=2509675 RepID=A0A4P6JW97_KTERU|nr:HAD-IIA family hydrolase [Ktedonosporobacter rubrisoli]QBD79968.1 HAD-IIA family hydrolase [Ktedonosporobacter rubrisoli]
MQLPYTTYLIDLDGVVYRGETLVPGAKEFIAWLNTTHKKYLFLTNNSFASETQVLAKLTRLGISTDQTHILGAGQAAVKNIARRFPGATVYVIGEQPLIEMVQQHGLQVASLDAHKADVVLVGLDRTFDYKKLTGAVLAVRKGAAFITINRDPLLPVENSYLPGCGTMTAAIEAGSQSKPEMIGKPEPTLLFEAMQQLNSQPGETVMIGDNLGVDILAGHAAGTHTILVLSGNDTRESLARATVKPNHVYENLAAIMDLIHTAEPTSHTS